ncbi:MAG TPA: GGDEF domain-containing protein, partial [Acidimicrobiales bacterium]
LASEDTLTGLPNRHWLKNWLPQALSDTAAKQRMLALLFVDLDNFKAINDTYGHSAGDAVLVEVAHRLRENVRAGDVVARLGGDEFVLLCEHTGTLGAVEVARHLCDAIDEPIDVDGRVLSITASIGIATTGRAGNDDHLLEEADHAMYDAKEAGRGAYRVFERSRPADSG